MSDVHGEKMEEGKSLSNDWRKVLVQMTLLLVPNDVETASNDTFFDSNDLTQSIRVGS